MYWPFIKKQPVKRAVFKNILTIVCWLFAPSESVGYNDHTI